MEPTEIQNLELADEYLNYSLARLKTGQGLTFDRWDHLPARRLVENRLNEFIDSPKDPVFALPDSARVEMFSIINDWYEGRPNPEANPGLNESIIIADGARPIGLLQKDRMDLIAGNGPFVGLLSSNRDRISKASLSVGRIERDLAPEVKWADTWYAGTGFYIGDNLLLTNRHVLQALAEKSRFTSKTSRKLKSGCFVNFDGQLQKVENNKSFVGQRRFRISEVVWTSDTIIPRDRDRLSEIDLAILKIENAPNEALPEPLVISVEPVSEGEKITVIGFPGRPPDFEKTYRAEDVLDTGNAEQIVAHFIHRGFGFKRASAGLFGEVAMGGPWNPLGKNVRHDCSTLTGNSGSPIFRLDTVDPRRPLEVSACHFFGWGRAFNVAHKAGVLRNSLLLALEDLGATLS